MPDFFETPMDGQPVLTARSALGAVDFGWPTLCTKALGW